MNTRQWKVHFTCFTAILTASVWALHAAAPVSAATAPMPVNTTIDASKTYAPISPYIYGMFLEHIRNSINSGMWSEMIEDRKFYYPITDQGPDPAGPASGVPGQQGARGGRGGRRGFDASRR